MPGGPHFVWAVPLVPKSPPARTVLAPRVPHQLIRRLVTRHGRGAAPGQAGGRFQGKGRRCRGQAPTQSPSAAKQRAAGPLGASVAPHACQGTQSHSTVRTGAPPGPLPAARGGVDRGFGPTVLGDQGPRPPLPTPKPRAAHPGAGAGDTAAAACTCAAASGASLAGTHRVHTSPWLGSRHRSDDAAASSPPGTAPTAPVCCTVSPTDASRASIASSGPGEAICEC